MKKNKTLHWILIAVGGGLLGLDLLFYFAVVGPESRSFAARAEEHQKVTDALNTQRLNVGKLENIQNHLQNAVGNEQVRFENHLWIGEDGFASLIQFLSDAASKNAVQKGRAAFRTTNQPDSGLMEVHVDLPLEGAYTDVVKFINALERSDHLIIIDTIALQTGQGNSGLLRLNLSLLTYFRTM
ncbi:MAG: GspMb/PilO family protein [Acidobacteriia bacterium]|nr:GspMb/PilO family protein [Terriglobia bacterium]